jgi:NH3-dependent NAD+ synthetase
LDAVLKELYDAHKSLNDVVAKGFDKATVERVDNLIKRSAFKRKQMAPKLEI